jgi:RimJ/RimL family protein N-acetyltransferase
MTLPVIPTMLYIKQGESMTTKTRLPVRIQHNDFIIKRLFSKKDIIMFNELIRLHKKNKTHLHFWHRERSETLFNNLKKYLNYLHNRKLLCYVIIKNDEIVGCIEISHVHNDYDSMKYRYLSFWMDGANAGKGIMFNALSVIEDTFRFLKLDYFLAQVDDKNEPSLKLLEKLFYSVKTKYHGMDMVGDRYEIAETTIEYKKNL